MKQPKVRTVEKTRNRTFDRRQSKTRRAIFSAFVKLLESKNYEDITVQDILDEADIGRSTFYAHFATKGALLKSLCEELFGHVAASASESDKLHTHGHSSEEKASPSIFGHLLQHLEENDNNILVLLSCKSNEMFLRYFKNSLKEMVRVRLVEPRCTNRELPDDFLVNHIAGSFVEMVLWWLQRRRSMTPETLDEYFRAVVEPILGMHLGLTREE